MPEEEAFCVLVRLMQSYRMREMFKPSMAELGLCMYQLEMLVQEHVPELFAHFQSQSIHTNLYASSWFLTLFTTAVPIGLACRIMDCFLADGLEVIFRLALALLMMGKHELLVQDMEGVIRVSWGVGGKWRRRRRRGRFCPTNQQLVNILPPEL